MVSKRVKKIIHDTVLDIWMNEIQKDYNTFRLLKEDSFKNAFYHHLRSRLGDTFLDEHGLFIWTEFNDGPLKGTGKRADIASVTIDRLPAVKNRPRRTDSRRIGRFTASTRYPESPAGIT